MFKKVQSKATIAAFIRVNHAGEYGASRIYAGQLAFIRDKNAKDEILHMQEQEAKHLRYFEQQLVKYDVRPSILLPIWHIGGYALGAVTAIMGKSSAMLCTEAVEEVIVDHYDDQIRYLDKHKDKSSDKSNQDLYNNIAAFRNEELEHKTIAANSSSQALINKPLSLVISSICRAAIFFSKKF